MFWSHEYVVAFSRAPIVNDFFSRKRLTRHSQGLFKTLQVLSVKTSCSHHAVLAQKSQAILLLLLLLLMYASMFVIYSTCRETLRVFTVALQLRSSFKRGSIGEGRSLPKSIHTHIPSGPNIPSFNETSSKNLQFEWGVFIVSKVYGFFLSTSFLNCSCRRIVYYGVWGD